MVFLRKKVSEIDEMFENKLIKFKFVRNIGKTTKYRQVLNFVHTSHKKEVFEKVFKWLENLIIVITTF